MAHATDSSSAFPVRPLDVPPDATIPVPGSKSLTNRALILAALADGRSTLRGALHSEDTEVMTESLRRLGIHIDAADQGETLTVIGRGGQIPASEADIFVANSGTSIRFLTAFVGLGRGRYRLDGVERMRQRPQSELLNALQQLGIDAGSERGDGRPPLVVRSSGKVEGGTAHLDAQASSQFVTALLMMAPYAASDVTLDVVGRFRPFYIDITLRMMEQWGVQACSDLQQFHVPAGQRYAAQSSYTIEPDASSAAYLFAAAAVTGGRVTVPGLTARALQGDVRFATEVLPAMGCRVTSVEDGLTIAGPEGGRLHGVDLDMSAISDTSLTLAAIAPFADSPTNIRNVGHSRLQESDRIAAACTELMRLGVRVQERGDGFTIFPAETLQPAEIETYDDHRVAMSFAVTGLRAPGISIRNPGCVAKTFPGFWNALARLRAGSSEARL